MDGDCAPTQGVTCVKASPGAAKGICRDQFGRCRDPCRDCNGGCPNGTTCTTVESFGVTVHYCATGGADFCVRADVARTVRYGHERCGDGPAASSQQDLCYFMGPIGASQADVFICGAACDGGTVCPAIPTSTAPLATTCRAVFGLIGESLSPPNQCAPASAFTP